MAKAIFHKNQRVYVQPVGTWAVIERLCPVWVKDVDQPIKVLYDVGLGREFAAHELVGEADQRGGRNRADEGQNWRLVRAKNKWQSASESAHHPIPGTFPLVVTDAHDWGGWRVPGAEYDRDPARIEFQARVFASSYRLLMNAKALVAFVEREAADTPEELRAMAEETSDILHFIFDEPASARHAAE